MDAAIGLVLTLVVQLVGYQMTVRTSEKTIEIVTEELKKAMLEDKKRRVKSESDK